MNKPFYLFNQKAQALTELVVFGSIILILLGVLLNYGLRYNYQQKVMQSSFKKAYEKAVTSGADDQPRSEQHMVLQDIHIPDPQNPFAVGNLTPVYGSAAVSRSNSYSFPENMNEVPHLVLNINGQESSFSLAGLRYVPDVSSLQEQKYILIYGAGNVNREVSTTACHWLPPVWDPIYLHNICGDALFAIYIVDDCDIGM
jgi:hypothetical protein